MATKGQQGAARSKKAKARDQRPTRQRYTVARRYLTNQVRRVLRQWNESLAKYLEGPRVHRRNGVTWSTPRRLDLEAARALHRLTGTMPQEAKAFLANGRG